MTFELTDHAMIDDLTLGATIKAARLVRGWSQEELAFRADLSQTVVSRVERGTNVSNQSTTRILNALEIIDASQRG